MVPSHLGEAPPKLRQATHVEGDRKVAVKLFRYGAIEDEVLAESFRRETTALRELRHPNIVELLDAGVDGDTKVLTSFSA